MSKKELIQTTAKTIYDKMDKKDRKEIVLHNAIEYHFSFGMWIRNNYIYRNEEFDKYEPDSMSQEIIEEIQSIVKAENK